MGGGGASGSERSGGFAPRGKCVAFLEKQNIYQWKRVHSPRSQAAVFVGVQKCALPFPTCSPLKSLASFLHWVLNSQTV